MWETEICVINTGESGRQRDIESRIGTTVWRPQPKKRSPCLLTGDGAGSWGGGEFTNPSEIGHMVFEYDSESVAGYTKFYITGQYRVAIPAVKEVNSSDIYIPHIASDTDWWTGISLVNTTSATKTLTITFNNGQSRQITLKPTNTRHSISQASSTTSPSRTSNRR